MSRSSTRNRFGRPSSTSRPRREWIGGHFPGPFHVTDQEEPYRPSVVAWMEVPSGLVVGHDVSKPGEECEALGRALAQALEHPLAGPVRRPTLIRVADEDLAAEIRTVVGDLIPITVAATPELADLADSMAEAVQTGKMDDPDGVEEASYFENGRVSAESVKRLFTAAQVLRATAPWKVANEQHLLRLDIPELDVDGACVSIIGALGEERGFVIFPSLAACEVFGSAAALMDGSPRFDLGTSWHSFLLVHADELPESMQREAEEHGWDAKEERYYPQLGHHDSDGLLRPLTERDVGILSTCAISLVSFFVQNRRAFEEEEWEPICASLSDESGLTVRFTMPYEAFPLFDVDAASAQATIAGPPKLGRNDPCHCGSGKKYKKCHLGEDRSRSHKDSRIDELRRIDDKLEAEMCSFARDRFGRKWSKCEAVFDAAEDSLQLLAPWSVHHYEVEGKTIRDWFRQSVRLSADEKKWLSVQDRTWLSVWEVVDVHGGESITLHDLLTEEVRCVQEMKASRTLARFDTVLARVTECGDLALLTGVHPRPLPPADGAEVVRRARVRLRRKSAIPHERLQDKKITSFLIRSWEEAVSILDDRVQAPLQLVNSDGDSVLFTVDHFEVDPARHGKIEACLATLDNLVFPHPDDKEPIYVFTGSGVASAGTGGTMLGNIRLSGNRLYLETNSRERADVLRRRLEEACGSLIRHRAREHTDPEALGTAGEISEVPEIQAPEVQQMLRDFQARHYQDWPDHSLPALDGRTPREAAATKKGRQEVDLLLKEMENHEQRKPPEMRYEFAKLRRELRLT